MSKRIAIFLSGFLLVSTLASAQVSGGLIIQERNTDTIARHDDINPLAPAKAAFYSAIFPGMGQLYNRKYWKMPLVYGAIGTSLYFYVSNDKKYNEFRDVYKRRLAGFNDDKYQFLDEDRLIRAQRFYQKNRDLSLLITAAFYVLNIIDANVDAHLMQFNVDDDLSLHPGIFENDNTHKSNIGLAFNYRF